MMYSTSENYSEIIVLGAKINKLCTETRRNADMVAVDRLSEVNYNITAEITEQHCIAFVNTIEATELTSSPADVVRSFNKLKEAYIKDLDLKLGIVPINDELIEATDGFLTHAQRAGYKKLSDIAELLDMPELNNFAIVNGKKGKRTNFQAMLGTIITRGENNFKHRKRAGEFKAYKSSIMETQVPAALRPGGSR